MSQVHNGTHNDQVQETEEPDVFGTYGDVHRMFVQAMMNRCTIAASEFSPLFEMICKNCNIQLDTYTKGDKQKALIVATNKVLESKCNMKVIKVYDEELTKKVSSLVLINRTDRSRDTNKLTIKGGYKPEMFLKKRDTFLIIWSFIFSEEDIIKEVF